MTRSCNFLHRQQALVIIVVTIAIPLTLGLQNCTGEPCMYGICMNNPNSSYSCYCIDGYTGINCEINWDDCWSNPCLNGGTCNDAVASYNCTCPDGFAGSNCEQRYSECMNHPCLNNGTCIDYNGFMCQCPEGYSGDYCEIDASVCNNTMCKNGGECMEGPGFSFYCKCTEGWSGVFCDNDVDECIKSPCQNGGLCLNVPATYTCACLFGYTGKDCDKAIVPCEKNPCENEAMCLLEDSQPVCYCVPDYHGQLCEQRYDDCRSKFAKCDNGGTCIDGINDFACSCPRDYSGETCRVYDPKTTPEVKVRGTDETSARTLPLPTMIYLNSQETTGSSSTTEIRDVSVTRETTNDDYSTTRRTLLETTISQIPNKTSSIDDRTEFDDLSRSFTSSATIDDNFDASTTSRVYLSAATTNLVSEATSTVVTAETTPRWDDEDSSTPVTLDEPEASSSAISTIDREDRTTKSVAPGVTSSWETSTVVHADTPESETSTELPMEFTTFNGGVIPARNESTEGESTESLREVTLATSSSAATTETDNDTGVFTTLGSFPDAATYVEEYTTIDDGIAGNTMESLFSEIIEMSTDEGSFSSPGTSEETVVATSSTRVETSRYNCNQEECVMTNCRENSSKCDCDGKKKCKDGPSIENAAFNGKSYLRQQVSIDADGALRIFVRLKTKSKSGVLVHAFFDDERYVLLYMEAGQLKFQFSCGLQTMLLGEIDLPINNGYDVDLEMRFQYLIDTDDIGKCSARLLVNDTMAMSGEQVLSSHENIPRQVRIHLGGIPQAFSHFFPRIAMGFIGCMSRLKINNVPRHFIHDSTETFQIEECTSFLCLLNPCRNFGSCHDIDGQIYCKCIAGYSGAVCERSACEDNPCYLGATCISSPGTGFVCVCPLGMHGLLCEEESPIVQPSFSVFIPGFSSYAAYGLTNAVKNAMELRMSLVPHSLEQISLIAFMGQSGSNRDVSDHFSLTYVRGYIMLTWDLGSGVRRIFTKTPLRTRVHRPHTLRAGRRGREAWLSIDGLGNVTGQAAGTMTQLDVAPVLYVGGHKSRNFEALPHDLPLHTGFYGCIYDVELRTDETTIPITKSSPATGRGVGECHRNECSHNACKNGALCLNHGPTYSCVCMKEWEGADCSEPAVKCSSVTPYRCHRANVSE